jgi:ABC-type lipoprotein release transport system permease subunit
MLAVLAGAFGGTVIAAAAGARRTDSAYPRFLKAEKAPDVLVFTPPDQVSGFARISGADLTKIPEVTAAGEAGGFEVLNPSDVELIAPADDTIGGVFFKKKMLSGRLARPDRADEVTISFALAEAHHLHVGDHLRLSLLAGDTEQGGSDPASVDFHVVGIDAAPSEFPPQIGSGIHAAWATPAFYKSRPDGLAVFDVWALQLRHGAADVPKLNNAVSALAGGRPAQAFALHDQSVNTQRSIHLQAVALWLLAGLLALTGTLVMTQLLVRQSLLQVDEFTDLRALGMSPSQLWLVGMARAALIATGGAAIGLAIALALSPFMPIGLAGIAEPHPGFAADAVALGLGVLATLGVVLVVAAWPTWRAARGAARSGLTRPSRLQRGSTIADMAARAGAPAAMSTGIRLALEPGQGRTAVPVRSTITGAAVAVVSLVTAIVFSASLNHLLGTPRLFGAPWDARVENVGDGGVADPVSALTSDPRIATLAMGYTGFPMNFGSHRADGIAMSSVRGGSLLPAPTRGRRPMAPDEIMLGSRTMASLHTHIGGTIKGDVAETGHVVSYRVVGTAVFPTLSDSLGLGKGVAITVDALVGSLPSGEAPPANQALFKLRQGVNHASALRDLSHRFSALGPYAVQRPDKPVDLVNFGRVQNLPLVLAGLLGALAAMTLTHLLVSSTRRRRRELAVLKTLGFAPRQVQRAVASQATTLALLAVGLGVPVGIVVGRWAWMLFAHQLGIVVVSAVPAVVLVLLIVGTIVVANMVAFVPGRIAAKIRPASVLRTE